MSETRTGVPCSAEPVPPDGRWPVTDEPRPLIASIPNALALLARAWPLIVEECRAVLGGELHYQAVVYHALRISGVPRDQIGMNVKQWITDPITPLFREWDLKKHADFRGGFEPIPDVVIFRPDIAADWRRRNREATLRHMLVAVEVKASERAKSRLGSGEVIRDIHKLAAHRDEVRHRGSDMQPVMMVIDTAPLMAERMTYDSVAASREAARANGVSFLYVAPDHEEAIWAVQVGTSCNTR